MIEKYLTKTDRFYKRVASAGRMAAGMLVIVMVCPLPDGRGSYLASAQVAQQQGEERAKDLSKRLMRGESTHTDAMQQIVQQMEKVEQRLTRSFDPGPRTQALQQGIIDDLDAAIASAIRRGARGSQNQGLAGDQRTRPRRSAGRHSSGQQTGSSQTDGDTVPGVSEPARSGLSGPFRESRRSWGHLPPRDRQEVIQGVGEESLEKFRRWIEQYYKALAEGDNE